MENTIQVASFVYVIHAIGTPRIKIGLSHNPEGRLKELQTGSSYRLRILHVVLGGRALEQLLHLKFAAYRKEGEWFELPAFSGYDLWQSMNAHPRPPKESQIRRRADVARAHNPKRPPTLPYSQWRLSGQLWQLYRVSYTYEGGKQQKRFKKARTALSVGVVNVAYTKALETLSFSDTIFD